MGAPLVAIPGWCIIMIGAAERLGLKQFQRHPSTHMPIKLPTMITTMGTHSGTQFPKNVVPSDREQAALFVVSSKPDILIV